MKRREFIDFMGKGALIVPTLPSFLSACNVKPEKQVAASKFPSTEDDLILADGLSYDVLIKEGDDLNDSMKFGTDNDYLAFIPESETEGLLWVNHENIDSMLAFGKAREDSRQEKYILEEMENLGGSILRIKKENGKWVPVIGDPRNNRLTAKTEIPFEWPEAVQGSNVGIGTFANCAGGVTPWGTVLTCEENYQDYYGEYDYETGEKSAGYLKWSNVFPDRPPQHYGWVVEVDLKTGKAKKQVGLGRMAHECATVQELEDGRVVVYTGDDKVDCCLYKFISDEPGQIYPGKLYAANLESGSWELVDISRPEIAEKCKDQTEVMIRAREMAKVVGGTELDRPEDIEIDPLSGDVFITLTNNKPKGNYHGSFLRIKETGGYDTLEFEHDTFLTGGEEAGFSCPDNMAFDKAGNLWFCSDISGSSMNKEPYIRFGNNGLFVLIRNGEDAGELFQVGSAPKDAELTGPWFMPDGETLMMSVQHPGSQAESLDNLTSNWPDGGDSIPRSAVVAIKGDLIKKLQTVS